MKFLAAIRERCFGIGCALLLACLCVPAAKARSQSSAPGSPNTKAVSSTPKTNSKKHHSAATQSSTKSSSVKSTGASHRVSSKGKRSSRRRVRGQQKIDSERAREIQEALIREHYLSGEATGTWNQASEDAIRRYQADHGWQSKTVPDSRALIKLGLGPSKDHLLNPESAMTMGPEAPRAASLNPESHGTDPVAPKSKTPSADPVPAASSTPTEPSSPQ